ncbi:hypothetical protein [Lentzea sp. E54]
MTESASLWQPAPGVTGFVQSHRQAAAHEAGRHSQLVPTLK